MMKFWICGVLGLAFLALAIYLIFCGAMGIASATNFFQMFKACFNFVGAYFSLLFAAAFVSTGTE